MGSRPPSRIGALIRKTECLSEKTPCFQTGIYTDKAALSRRQQNFLLT
ncbi:hypothetical protein HMPREF9370_0167 [Neisseria wadsworthii 9715]|uniref:Uncharacterized protein n=1 Tax=Neisseria wadsworthii 9715 TaxID=1030841 RepID=G4CM58_9NEIS|nr:hypothetical protein HMPREF9370_0167 [Neisseria wadsworthii 9715]